MAESESQIDKRLEAHRQRLDQIEAYYTERGGVGSPDLIAFGDALRLSALAASVAYIDQQIKSGGGELWEKSRESVRTRFSVAQDTISTHEEIYPGFPQLYTEARQQISDVVRYSPYSPTHLSKYGHNLGLLPR